MCTYLHQTKAHWRESFIFPHFLFIFSRQSRRFLSFANRVLLVDSAVILQSGTRRHHHHRTFFQNLGFAVSAFIFLSEIRVCGSALISLIRDLWIGFYLFLARTCDCLRLGLSLSLSLLLVRKQRPEKHKIDAALSQKTICPDFFEPQTVAQPPVEEIWEHRSSTEISTQNLISWVFLHYAWIYWLIHDLLLLGFMGFFFFFFPLIYVFLFHSVCWSHL